VRRWLAADAAAAQEKERNKMEHLLALLRRQYAAKKATAQAATTVATEAATIVAAATEPEPDQELGAHMELEPELQPELELGPEVGRALEQEPELKLESGALDTAAVLARMTQVVAAAKMTPATPAPFALKTSRRPPFSPVMDEPSPPRCAVRSDDTKIFDRGKRRCHTHTTR
jgi:hypothetical protein